MFCSYMFCPYCGKALPRGSRISDPCVFCSEVLPNVVRQEPGNSLLRHESGNSLLCQGTMSNNNLSKNQTYFFYPEVVHVEYQLFICNCSRAY